MTDNDEKKKVIWSECDQMLHEGKDRKEITGRKVAARKDVQWSHTTVTPYVTDWQDHRTRAEQDMLEKTQMSLHFVKALTKEVEERVTRRREIDANQIAVIHEQLGDMISENEVLETKISTLEHEITDINTKLVTANAELEQAMKTQEVLKEELKKNTTYYEDKLEKVSIEHSVAISEANAKHAEAIEKLNSRLDDKSNEVSKLNADLARSELKASLNDKLTRELSETKERILTLSKENSSLTNENVKISAEMNATRSTLQNLTESLNDTKSQRDKAQKLSEVFSDKLEAAQQKLNDHLIKFTRSDALPKAAELSLENDQSKKNNS